MANQRFTDLPAGTALGTDMFAAVDVPADISNKYTRSQGLNYDLSAMGLTTYNSVLVASTGAFTVTYANGTLGVGATATNAGAQAALSIDSVVMAVSDRVLIKDQASTFENGIYTVTDIGSGSTNWVMTRATDYDQAADVVQYGVTLSDSGAVNAGLLFQETGAGPWTMGTTPIVFSAFAIGSGTSVNAGLIDEVAYYAAAGSTVSGLTTANNGLLVTSAGGTPSIGNAILANITVNGIEVGKGANSVANNTAVGAGALDGAVTGGGNTAIGQNALTNLTSGTLNTAVGYNALSVVSNASNNTALGVSAGTALNGGGRNTAIGVSALLKATSGGGNTAVGMETLVNITTTSFNTALGDSALVSATTADSNTAIGYGSGKLGATGALSLLTGDKNTFLGFQSCADDAAAAGTLALGADAVSTIATGATSGDNGPGIAIGSAAYPVGFRGDATIYPGAFGRVKWNGTQYMLPLQADGATSIAVTSGGTGLSSTTANQILYSSATSTIAGLATANNGILSTNGSGVPAINNTVDLVGQLNVDNLRLDGNTVSSTSGGLIVSTPTSTNMEVNVPTSGNAYRLINGAAAGRTTTQFYRNTSEKMFEIVSGLTSGFAVSGDDTFLTATIASANIHLRTTAGTALSTSGTGVTVAGALSAASATFTAALPVTSGGTGVTTSTGTGSVVLSNTPTLVTPALGAATATSINFGGSTLSNYDEGTFTLTISSATVGDLSVVYGTRVAQYRRIGNIVAVTCRVDFTPTYTTASGNFSLEGFPFAASAAEGAFSIRTLSSFSWGGSKTMLTIGIGASSTFARLTGLQSAGAGSILAIGNFPTGVAQAFYFAGTYTL